jgi:hypothetical protein
MKARAGVSSFFEMLRGAGDDGFPESGKLRAKVILTSTSTAITWSSFLTMMAHGVSESKTGQRNILFSHAASLRQATLPGSGRLTQ